MVRMAAETQGTASPFSGIMGQSQVTRFLEQAASEGRLSHAYLFAGPVGSGKTEVTFALARALLCPSGGCGECDTCRRIARQTHSDVHWIEPEGVGGYVVDQIHDLIHDSFLAPVRANHKLYVITRADLLRGQAANALLKTLEEPPRNTSFVLMARSRDAVMATLVSRCQTLVFRRLPDSEAIGLVKRATGANDSEAAMALAAVGGSTKRACEFLGSEASRNVRIKAIECLERLSDSDLRDVIDMSRELMAALRGPQKELEKKVTASRKNNEEFMSTSALKYFDKQQERKIKGSLREGLDVIFSVVSSWLRDCLLVSIGLGDLKVNVDCHYTINKTGRETTEQAILAAQRAVDVARRRISANVTPELVLETMLFDIREVLHANRGSG